MFQKIFLSDASKQYHIDTSMISHQYTGLLFLKDRVKKAKWDTVRTNFNLIKHLNNCLHLSLSFSGVLLTQASNSKH